MQRTMQAGEFHGVRRDTVHLQGLTLAETQYEPGHRLAPHAHERPFFSLLIRGSFKERHDRGMRQCVPTSLVFYPEHEPHEEAFGPRGGRAFHVELDEGWLSRMRAEGGLDYQAGSSETLEGRQNLLMSRLYGWFLRPGPEVSADEIALELLSAVVPDVGYGEERKRPPWLDRIIEILRARFCERIRVAELADEAGVHPVHLARVFRRHFGCTIGEYIRMLRIERARVSLVNGDQGLSSIAFATGFADQAHFTRTFKDQVGVPPGEYRKLVLEG